jgi:hypothetical protein
MGLFRSYREAPASRRAFRLRSIVAMAKQGNNVHIPLPEKEALRLLFKVKPTEDMPRPGANPTKANPKGKVRTKRAK